MIHLCLLDSNRRLGQTLNFFSSQINQAGSNYYPPPAASQLRQQHSFQQAIVAPQSVTYTQVH